MDYAEGTNSNKSVKLRDDWRQKSRPIPPGGTYPAKDHCSRCGLCDTYYIAHVKNACAFLDDGMSKIEALEPVVHGRGRKTDSLDETYMGVYENLLYARKTNPVEGAQWTGIVTTIAMEMLRTGMVEAVVCVQSDPEDRFIPRPILARLLVSNVFFSVVLDAKCKNNFLKCSTKISGAVPESGKALRSWN